jgi:segregation and condensation protein B
LIMSDVQVLPELKQIVGALLFGAKQPISAGDLHRVMVQVGEIHGGVTRDFAKVSEKDIAAAVDQLRAELADRKIGIHLSEVAGGYRLENDVSCGPWLRHLLERGRPTRLSRPALETLAIIAYRQPCMRSEIELVRGVQVDQIIRNLLEMGLIRIVGRSELPGRPWQFGTTQKFLEHFGLNSIDDLPGVEELRRREAEQIRKSGGGGEQAEGETTQMRHASDGRDEDAEEGDGEEDEVEEKVEKEDEKEKDDEDEDDDEDEKEDDEDDDEDEEEEDKS